MRNWIEVTRNIPGLSGRELFERFHREATHAFRDQNNEDCKCTSIHTVYPEDKLVVFAFTVRTDSSKEAQKLAEESVDAALGNVFVLGVQ